MKNYFITNRVARKLFLQFIICAMIPIVTLAVISYFSIARQMKTQSQRYLHLASKITIMSFIAKLNSLESELQGIVNQLPSNHPTYRQINTLLKSQDSFTTLKIIPPETEGIPKFTGKTILLSTKGNKA